MLEYYIEYLKWKLAKGKPSQINRKNESHKDKKVE